jgi:hypothetical protein
MGVVFNSTNVWIVEISLGELTEKRIPRPSAYGLASENIFLIAAGSELAIARPQARSPRIIATVTFSFSGVR